MEDTSPNTAAGNGDPGEIVEKLLWDIGEFPVFREALNAFGAAYRDVNAPHGRDSLRSAAVSALDESAWNLVAAAANYYCAHTLYDILAALEAEDAAE